MARPFFLLIALLTITVHATAQDGIPKGKTQAPGEISCANFNISNPEPEQIEINVSYDAERWTPMTIRSKEWKIIEARGNERCYVGINYNGKRSLYIIKKCIAYMLVVKGGQLSVVQINPQ